MPSRAHPVLVTGATGRIGRLVVNELVRAGIPVRALTRSPAEAALPAGVDVVRGDFADPSSLDAALDGIGSIFLVWTTGVTTAGAVIDRLAAKSADERRRVVYLSSPHQTSHPFFQQPNAMRALHVELERLLAAADIDTVVLRPGIFASNALHWWAPQLRAGDVVRWPCAAAETAPVDERDLAAVASRALVDTRLIGRDFVLTGGASLSQREQLQCIGDAIGRTLRYDELSPDEFRRETAATWPPGIADMLLGAWLATLGHRAFVTDDIQLILGVPPRSFGQWAADHAAAFGRDA